MIFCTFLGCSAIPTFAEPVPVRQPKGLLRGFVLLRSLDGKLLATGDLSQVVKGANVTNELSFQFKDGSVHKETAVFSQKRTNKLLTYRLIQKGPSFKRPTDMALNQSTGKVTIRYTDEDGKEETISETLELPPDVANGMVVSLLHDLDPKVPTATVSMVANTPKPRLVKLDISAEGEETFSVGGAPRKATRYVVKVEIGGIAGVIAPLVGKQPPDTYIWMVSGAVPGFLKSEGPLSADGPIWRIELASPDWPKNAPGNKP